MPSRSPDSMAEDYQVVLMPNVATYDILVWSAIGVPLPGASVYLAPVAEPLNHAGWTDAIGWGEVCVDTPPQAPTVP